MSRTSGRRPAFSAFRLAIIVLMALGVLPASSGAQGGSGGVTTLTGSLVIDAGTLAIYSEPAVVLSDTSVLGEDTNATTGSAPVPSVASQITTGLVPESGDRYSFSLSLPIAPQGTPVSLSGADADADELPQVFSIDIVSNVAGQPALTSVDAYSSSPSVLSSTGTNDAGALTGQFAVWSDGNGAQFPSAVGDDGEALTSDDPLRDLDAGWTIVDISDDTYDFDRDSEVAIRFVSSQLDRNDFSSQGWTEAFESLVDDLEAKYPFTDYKGIDFDQLRKTYVPMVQKAEDDDDSDAYALAVYRFGLEFGDGHVSSSPPIQWIRDNYLGGYGLAVGRADDGTVFVTDVVDGSGAAKAGIEPGDTVERWDGKAIADAIADTPLLTSASSDFSRELQRVRAADARPGWQYRRGGVHQRRRRCQHRQASGQTGSRRLHQRGLLGVRAQRRGDADREQCPAVRGWLHPDHDLRDRPGPLHPPVGLRDPDPAGARGHRPRRRRPVQPPAGLASLAFYASATFAEDPFVLDTGYAADRNGRFEDIGDEVIPVAEIHWDGKRRRPRRPQLRQLLRNSSPRRWTTSSPTPS